MHTKFYIMKRKQHYFATVLAMVGLLIFGACEKDDGRPDIGEGSFSMEIDGQHWGAIVSGVSTFDAEEFDDDDELHGAMISAASGTAGEDGYTSIMLVLALSEARLHSANGTYSFVLSDDDFVDGRAAALYTKYHNGVALYAMAEGEVTITDFDLGEQTFMGMSMGRGFTYMTGTFRGTLQLAPSEDAPADAPPTLTITNGKFSVPGTSGLLDIPGMPGF